MSLATALTLFSGSAYAHSTSGFPSEFNIKTNLLQDAVGTLSLGTEYRFSRKFSIDVMGAWNPWIFKDNMMYRQWNVSPQLKWWPGDKGHFLALTLMGGEFNYNRVSLPYNASPSLHDYRYEGWNVGGGIAYGYRYDVTSRFALEATVGVGVSHVDYDKYLCDRCGEKVASGTKLYVGSMRTGLNLIYRIGGRRTAAAESGDIPMRRPTVIHDTVTKILHDTIYIKDNTAESLTDVSTGVHRDTFALRLTYPVSSAKIIPTFGDNRAQLDSLSDFISSSLTNPDIKVLSIELDGYASIEGDDASNTRLSRRRADSVARLIEGMYPGLGTVIVTRGLGEDWETLQFDGKDNLMRIPDRNRREAELRKIDGGREFRSLLRDKLPDTRRVECIITYTNY